MLASGGAALSAETQRFWERLGVRVVQGYGASECSPVIACGAVRRQHPDRQRRSSRCAGVEIRLSRDGELLVRGPNVMRGYWQDPARTAEVLRDGWYATGDLRHRRRRRQSPPGRASSRSDRSAVGHEGLAPGR